MRFKVLTEVVMRTVFWDVTCRCVGHSVTKQQHLNPQTGIVFTVLFRITKHYFGAIETQIPVIKRNKGT
jgi:hypothetical protein